MIELLTGAGRSSRTSCLARSNSSLASCQRGLALVDGGNPRMQSGDLVVDVLHGVLQFPAPASRLRFDAAHRGARRLQVRLCGIDGRLLDGDGGLIRLLVEFDEKVAPVHAVVVVDENPGNLAADAGGDEGHMTVHEGVIGRNGVESMQDPGNAEDQGGQQNQHADRPQQQPPPLCRRGIFCGRFRRRIFWVRRSDGRGCVARRSFSRFVSHGMTCDICDGAAFIDSDRNQHYSALIFAGSAPRHD